MAFDEELSQLDSAGSIAFPVIGGLLSLAVAMGIGRFAYTPLLPYMQQSARFSAAFAGTLASWNYLGYFVGAIISAFLPVRVHKDVKLRYGVTTAGLLGSAVTTTFMGVANSHLWWFVLRGFSGLFSAIVLVVSSSLVMDWLVQKGAVQKVGMLYSGVGVGIVFTGLLVPFLSRGGWKLGWLGLGGLSGILIVFALICMRKIQEVNRGFRLINSNQPELRSPFPLWSITLAYGLEGLGYIVMATFISKFFSDETTFAWLGTVSWIFVGLAAIPSTWLWTKAAHKFGWGVATVTAFVVQAVGILLPVVRMGIWEGIVGSILFGGTFMGITSLALSIGRMCSPGKSAMVIGSMTALFSLGQVAGPVLAGALIVEGQDFGLPLALSGFVIFAAALLLLCTRRA